MTSGFCGEAERRWNSFRVADNPLGTRLWLPISPFSALLARLLVGRAVVASSPCGLSARLRCGLLPVSTAKIFKSFGEIAQSARFEPWRAMG